MKQFKLLVGTLLLSLGSFTAFAGGPPSAVCTDRNEYVADVKEVGATGNYSLIGGTGALSRAAQTYFYSGSGTLTTVRVHGAVPVSFFRTRLVAKLYNVDATNRPTGIVATSYYEDFYWFESYQDFDFPGVGPAITGNFAVSVELYNPGSPSDRFDVAYTGDGEGNGEDLASLAGSSTGFNWSSAMTSFSKDGDFYIEPVVRHDISASFTKNAVCLGVGQSVGFTNTSALTLAPMFNLANPHFEWDFGDGSAVATTTNASHSYATPGFYTISLTTYFQGYGGTSCSHVVTQQVSVGLAASATNTNALCYGNNGSLTASATGGKTPYMYSLDGVAYQSSATFSRPAGTYSVFVRDALGCVASTSVTIGQPTQVVIGSVPSTNSSCGNTNGALLINAAGGTAPLQYSINGGTNFQSSNSFSSLGAGIYNIVVKDANNCSVSTSATVIDNAGPSIAFQAQTNVACHGSSTGSIAVIGSGGTGTLTYSINGTTFQSNGVFNNLPAGSYGVIVKDQAGCINGLTIDITEPGALAQFGLNVNQHVSCNGGNDGQLQVAVGVGGIGTYSYSINGVNFQSSPVFSNLSAGSYTITVKDVAGCSTTLSAVINQPSALNLTASAVGASCWNATNGTITLSANGGTSPYYYTVGESFSTTNNVFEGLGAGTYTVQVTDANGCTATSSIAVTQPAPIQASITTGASTCGGSDGTLGVIGSGGSGAPYTYSIDNITFGAAGTYSGLAAGNYFIVVRDNAGCEVVFNTIITTTTGPSINTVSSTNVSCFGGNDGSISVTNVTGGTGTLYYSLDGSAFQTSNTFTGVTGGHHIIVVQDQVGCSSSDDITITEPAEIIVGTSINDHVSCFGYNDGSVSVNAAGGIGQIVYSLNGGFFQSANTFNSLTAGLYQVVAKDAAGCTSSANFIVFQPTQILVGAGYLNVTCNGAQNGEIFVNSSGGTGTHEYSLNNVTYTSNSSFTGLNGGNYTVFVQDDNGCVASIPVTLAEPAAIVLSSMVSNVSCAGGSNGVVNLSVSGGTPVYTFAWNNGSTNEDIFNLVAGNYSVIVTDDNGCIKTATYSVTAPTNPIIINGVITNATGATNANGSVDVTITGGTPPYSYSWSNGAVVEDLANVLPGVYSIQVTDAAGCQTSVGFTVNFTVGVDEAVAMEAANIYPNPANYVVNVDAGDQNIRGIRMVNMVGQIVYSAQPNATKTTIDLSSIASGVYFVQIEGDNGMVTKKIEVVK
ncbi:MAG TPA: hypothetical protein DEP18_01665 [Flavobacteriales bacterium]|nr:hypothetical protein [Flavobacteriales bacterium]HRJ35475.1 T9SS type A sorting domain-containing protein [Flavobacteriales bacterium]HRJ37763.1 T9SS type A sorting domain-containing protein [Flavobacteriales bacterium]